MAVEVFNDEYGLLHRLEKAVLQIGVVPDLVEVDLRDAEFEERSISDAELPKALSDCINPPRFVLEAISEPEAISEVFPVASSASEGYDSGWACVLLL